MSDFHVLRMKELASSELTDGAFELIEDVRAKDGGPAAHIHRRSDEAFYVLEGHFTFTKGDEQLEAGPGTFIFIPRGTRHCYRARDDGSRTLILYAPGGLAAFLKDVDKLLVSGLSGPQAMAALAGKHDSDPVP